MKKRRKFKFKSKIKKDHSWIRGGQWEQEIKQFEDPIRGILVG